MNSKIDDADESINNKYLRSHQRPDGPLINIESVGFKRYNNLDEIDKVLKEALRVNKILKLSSFIFSIIMLVY